MHQQRAYALAAAKHGVAHGGVQALWRDVGLRQQFFECAFGVLLDLPHPFLE